MACESRNNYICATLSQVVIVFIPFFPIRIFVRVRVLAASSHFDAIPLQSASRILVEIPGVIDKHASITRNFI